MPSYPQWSLTTAASSLHKASFVHMKLHHSPKRAWTWLMTTMEGDLWLQNSGEVPWPEHPEPEAWNSKVPWQFHKLTSHTSAGKEVTGILGNGVFEPLVSSSCKYLWPLFREPLDYSVPLRHPSMTHTSTHRSAKARHRHTGSQQQSHSRLWD